MLTIKDVILQVLLPLLNKCSVVMDDGITGSALFTASTTRYGSSASTYLGTHEHMISILQCSLAICKVKSK